jgi:hypothetical protein
LRLCIISKSPFRDERLQVRLAFKEREVCRRPLRLCQSRSKATQRLSARVAWRRGRNKAEDDEEYAQNQADAEVEVVRGLFKGDPDRRGQHEGHSETVEEAFFHRLSLYSAETRPRVPSGWIERVLLGGKGTRSAPFSLW